MLEVLYVSKAAVFTPFRPMDVLKTSLSVHLQVLVNVLDVNDVTPTFPRAYEGPFEVTEGQPGPRVWTLRASDEDSGLNGKVEYSITGGDHQSETPPVLSRA